MKPVDIPLGNLLAIAHYLPELCPSGPPGVFKTLCFLTQLPLQTVGHVMHVWPVARALVLHQHPRLNNVTLPLLQLQCDEWAYVWAWLDRQEMELGPSLPTNVALDGDWYRLGWAHVPRAVTPEGLPLQISFQDHQISFL